MAHWARRSAGLALGGLLSSVGCGNGDDLDPYARLDATFTPIAIGPAEPYPPRPGSSPVDVPTTAEPTGEADPGADPGAGEPVAELPGAGETPAEGDGVPVEPAADPDLCVTPTGVSGSPRDLSEAMILMNSLPKPVTLACFLQALTRPLSLYMTSSGESLQPSPGPRSPRTFIVFEPLVMSIVLDGPAQGALEFGYRSTPTRSVKTEILFPLQTDVTFDNLFDDVRSGTLTKCGNCHTGEIRTFDDELAVEVFESDIIAPYETMEVDLPALRAERERCDPASEPSRCALLSALFDHGEVRAAPRGFMF